MYSDFLSDNDDDLFESKPQTGSKPKSGSAPLTDTIFKDVEIFEGSHDGTFGTITRFLPFYNLPEVSKNIKWIWISDIDLPSYIFSYENIKDLKTNKAKVSFFSAACNNREWFPDTVRYPISAGKTIVSTDVKFNISDLEIFLG